MSWEVWVMTSKTSLFNKGIYKSTVRRYAWGSIFYFILLFLFTGMMILLNEDPQRVDVYWSYGGYSTLLGNSYMIIPMLISLVVPTVTGLLIFRYIQICFVMLCTVGFYLTIMPS